MINLERKIGIYDHDGGGFLGLIEDGVKKLNLIDNIPLSTYSIGKVNHSDQFEIIIAHCGNEDWKEIIKNAKPSFAGTLTLLVDGAPGDAEDVACIGASCTRSTFPPRRCRRWPKTPSSRRCGLRGGRWASFATNRGNVAGTAAVQQYRDWGEAKLARFRARLDELGQRARSVAPLCSRRLATRPVATSCAGSSVVKTLTSTLLAAQLSESSQPYVKAKVDDYWGNVARLRFSRYYSGVEDDGFVAAAVAPDGSLIRAYLDDTGATSVLYVSRVAAPGPGSTFSAWTSLVATVSNQAGVALCVEGSAVLLFYVDTDDVSLKLRVSSDNGATWAAATSVSTASGAVGALAAAGNGSGDVVAFWSEGATVYRARYTSGAWGSRTAWTRSVGTVSGLACCYLYDWQVIVAGSEVTTLKPRVYALRYGDGFNQASNTWGTLREVVGAEADSGISYASPAVVDRRDLGFSMSSPIRAVRHTTGCSTRRWATSTTSTTNAGGSRCRGTTRATPTALRSHTTVPRAFGSARLRASGTRACRPLPRLS